VIPFDGGRRWSPRYVTRQLEAAVVVDWTGIAGRINGLISMSDRAQIESAAARLGVDQQTLRLAVHDKSPTATLRVINALIRVYGLDPTWVMTGQYDAATHRAAMEGDAKKVEQLLSQILSPLPALEQRHEAQPPENQVTP
jgi:hypothetical protein